MRFWRWMGLLGALLLASPASAAWPPDSVRYVRADADGGNNGRTNTSAGAWTLAEACAQATAGYTVLIGPGSYTSTTLSPSNSGDVGNPPWPGSHGRIRFVGNTENAQACSVSAISINKPYITVMGVSVKVGGSLSLGNNGSLGAANATFDSLYRVYLKRTTSAFAMYGVQNSVVASCTLMNYPSSSSGRAFVMSAETGNENACARTNGSRVCQTDTLTSNYFHAEGVRVGERRFLLADHTQRCYVSGNTFVGYASSTLPTGNNANESLIFFELARSYYNEFLNNRFIFDSDYNYTSCPSPDWCMRGIALRDSSYFNVFRGDTVYAGIDYNGRGGSYANSYPIYWAIGQSGQPCTSGGYAGAYDNSWYGGRYILTGSLGPKDSFVRARIESCLVVSTKSIGLDLGNLTIANATIRNNTVVAFNGKRAISNTGETGISTGTNISRNIWAVDSIPPIDGGGSAGTGGVLFANGINQGQAYKQNLYYARKTASGAGYRAARDSSVKWTWQGYFRPDSGSNTWRRSTGANQDGGSRWGDPIFSDSSATKAFNGAPKNWVLVKSVAAGGYVGALAPADTIKPGVVASFTVNASGDNLTKTITWTDTGDDSSAGLADSVFVCERADSNRIDSTNWRSYIMYGFRCVTKLSPRTYICDAAGTPVEVPDPAWSGCGNDVLGPGNEVGWYRIAIMDEAKNLSFSRTLQAIWSP